MATLNFPSDPGAQTPVNTYGPDSTPLSTSNNITYVWDGEKWVASTQNSSDARYVNVTGDTMTGDLTVPNLISQGTVTGTNIPTNGSIVGYQQGVWTPTVAVGTITNSRSNWTRIGNSVTVYSYISDFTGIGNEANIAVRSLPYPHSFSQAAGSCFYKNIKAGYDTTFVTDNESITSILFYTGIETDWSALKYSNISTGGSIYFMATYITADTTWTPANGATVS